MTKFVNGISIKIPILAKHQKINKAKYFLRLTMVFFDYLIFNVYTTNGNPTQAIPMQAATPLLASLRGSDKQVF